MFERKDLAPTPTFNVPVVFPVKDSDPIAVLLLAVVLASRARFPNATLSVPVVFAYKE